MHLKVWEGIDLGRVGQAWEVFGPLSAPHPHPHGDPLEKYTYTHCNWLEACFACFLAGILRAPSPSKSVTKIQRSFGWDLKDWEAIALGRVG